MNPLHVHQVMSQVPEVDGGAIKAALRAELEDSPFKVIVLDDDPTGIQTVHGVSVYTDWDKESIHAGFSEDRRIFFILTNSRGFTERETKEYHEQIAERVQAVSDEMGIPYVIISRGDSTLRGNYPLETETLKQTIEKQSDLRFDGEIIIPFFKEGGRFTINDVHYVQEGDMLIPVGETEFAKDRTFGFTASHLGEWIEEKTDGKFTKEGTIYISLDDLRNQRIEKVKQQLLETKGFQKVVVNAVGYEDVEVFSTAFMRALKEGKRFLCRSAAALTKVLGGISDKSLLLRANMVSEQNKNGGLIVVGSHVKKTTQQLNHLLKSGLVKGIEFDVHLVQDEDKFKQETKRVRLACEEAIKKGQSVVYFTRRERLDLGENMKEEELKQSVKISDAVTSIVRDLSVQPSYIVAKGGITSSSIGTMGLSVKRAEVAGQVKPGIPVWTTGQESKFPDASYVIFPGNVGQPETLKEVIEVLEGK
ncbi:type III effector Hrp-dependent outer protein [Alkalihalobacillus alcalophilus ATCC 27647 = CGMCC 1.3604]|uniref:Hydroxyacid dehydrogenase n=1 Tax=Alkalihalobacillus alcalophilus ATCC 27647 = CGMCC 1.3604 TaxID=1218173 RepID=A0A094WM46_ALKAL|nr:four-carbon acid sugar kinase family protein [Alkalihalobacillus alcalophilus]KGA98804.1 hydroxyacid dehydrogenase [Alkalihalobacillus alcalophilus ATCC 27647 = CGMCC 1.3604]MED1560988.1 four-carbon acid sugar kinase family protein [Alkalihalobacillus alcalophilus]THG88641.1 type III effector Hrp-dependent outer protein [Alkalihalobacillus alcalophilus ATCC 27647 = CGMCC 1.3604]